MKRGTARQKDQGFTIIELVIVLAISGIILSIVIMALPALQRSSRNNTRKNDVSSILQTISRYEVSNSGDFPSSCSGGTCRNGFLGQTKLYYYDDADIEVRASSASSGDITSVPGDEGVVIANYHRCGTGSGGARAVDDAAGYFDVAALYKIETADGRVLQCQQL